MMNNDPAIGSKLPSAPAADAKGGSPATPAGPPASGPSTSGPPPRLGARLRNTDLIDDIKRSADELAAVDTSRGDLKILSRAMRELAAAFRVFAPYRWRRKVTVFGSARTQKHAAAYGAAVAFGRAMAEQNWFVVTGASTGIMEAGHVGAGREASMGLNIVLPFEQDANPVIAGDHKLVNMKYFFTRKLMFVKECDAVACFPGGFGTLDEAFEVLTLLQTGKRDLVPVVLVDAPGGRFWAPFDTFLRETLLPEGMISPEDLSLYKITDSTTEAVDEVLRFYRVYHSMRYVKSQLVLRLLTPLTPLRLAEINATFADILQTGEFQQRSALPEEKDEPKLANLPRLTLHFNRRSLGRLRQLVDWLNAESNE